jgi:hypothetical protein
MWRIAPATAEPVSPNLNPELKNMDTFTAAKVVGHSYQGGARQLGLDIGHPALSQELSETGTAKLGLKTAVMMTVITKDLRILDAFASQCGQMIVPLPASLMVDGDVTMHALGQVAREFGEVVQEVSVTCADGEVSANELARVEKQWGELVAAGRNLVMGLRAKHEASKPASLRAVG